MVRYTLLARLSSRDEVSAEQVDQALACVCKLELDLFALASDEPELGASRSRCGILSLDALDIAPVGTGRARDALVRDREEVAVGPSDGASGLRAQRVLTLRGMARRVAKRLGRCQETAQLRSTFNSNEN